ncbi:MAG: hypothetical protein AAF543_20530 [Pseudomonadota bacterium]
MNQPALAQIIKTEHYSGANVVGSNTNASVNVIGKKTPDMIRGKR